MSALSKQQPQDFDESSTSEEVPGEGHFGEFGRLGELGDLAYSDDVGFYTSCSPFECLDDLEDDLSDLDDDKVIAITSSPEFGAHPLDSFEPTGRLGQSEPDLFGDAMDESLSTPESQSDLEYGDGGGGNPPRSNFFCGGYDQEIVESVWQMAERVEGNDDALWRRDEFGAWIYRLDYGHRHSQFGWEISDLNTGRAEGGIAALRPMHWQNYLDQVVSSTQSCVTADGLRNVRK